MKHQRQPVYGHHGGRRQYKMSSTSYSSYSDTAGGGRSDTHLPTLIPDPLAPPTSIDSPPRYYSATLPPPRTKMHAAATQTMSAASKRRYTETLRYKRRAQHPSHYISHSYSSSTRTSTKSTPKHHVSTSTSPITLDPTCLSGRKSVISMPRETRDSGVSVSIGCSSGANAPSLTTCNLHPCSTRVQHKDTCASVVGKQMSVVDILDDLKTSEHCNKVGNYDKDTLGNGKTVSGLAVSCPRPPVGKCVRSETESCMKTRDQSKNNNENDINIVTNVSKSCNNTGSGLVGAASVQDSATSPTERQDLINKIGKRIRFRKKKKEKLKTENRARKALKTISLILGAFVTCWTPYHILAIIASFCPSCVNIHIYMLSYFLCYANR